MNRKLLYALIVTTATIGLLAATSFAADMSSKKKDESATEYLGKGVGAMQGKETPSSDVPKPATTAAPSEQETRQDLSKEAEGGVGAMQGRENPPPDVPKPAGAAASSGQETQQGSSQGYSTKETEGSVGAMQGRENPPPAVPQPAVKSPR